MTPDHTTVATLVTDLATAGPRLAERPELARFLLTAVELGKHVDSAFWTDADLDAVRAIVTAPAVRA